jgi:lipoprotein-releasing system permease protein
MSDWLGAGWQLLTAAGGTLALSFIIAIALGINALTLLFLGSAVVVLERFARAARRLWTSALAALVVAAGAGGLLAELRAPDAMAAGGEAALRAFGESAGVTLLAVAVGVPLVRLGLRFLPPARLGRLALVVLGLGYGLAVGGTGKPLVAAAPLAVAGIAAGFSWLRRRGRGAAGEWERLLWLLAAVLVPGLALAFGVRRPVPVVAGVGAATLIAVVALVVLGLLPLAAAGLVDMRRSAEWFIAVRYLVAKRRQTFISVITLICVGGVAVGVWLIITVLSVMNGFERTWRDEIIGNRAHFTVQSGLGPFEGYRGVLGKVLAQPDVIGASPYIDAEGMVRGPQGQIVGVRLRGIDPRRIEGVTDLAEDLKRGAGSLEGLESPQPPPTTKGGKGAPAAEPEPGILIGSELAGAFGLQVGDDLLLVSPFGGPPTPLGPGPRLKRFRVVGIFKTSFFQWDEVFTYTSLSAAQDFRRVGDVVDGIEVRVRDFYRSQRVAHAVESELGYPFYTRDWKEYFPAFFQALKTERMMMFFLLTMIMVVAAFVIVATLIMMIMEKSSDIAILKAMGAEDSAIERIFAIEGALIGLVGTVAGVIGGIVVTTQLDWIQKQIEAITGIDTLPASVYQLSTLPWEIDALQIAMVATIAMILSLGATLLPSRQGARLDPAEALRYE